MLAAMYLHNQSILQQMQQSTFSKNAKVLFKSIVTCLMVMAFSISAKSQTLNATVSPLEICEGQAITFFVTPPVPLPSGVTVQSYTYQFDISDLSNSSTGPSTSATKANYKPGTYTARVVANLSNSTTITSNDITVNVFHLPIAGYNITTQDTQCARGNQFCVTNLSIQNPLSPSNPIANTIILWGDASPPGNLPSCKTYPVLPGTTTISTYTINVKTTDTKGCVKDTFMSPSRPLAVKPNLTPSFTWTFLFGPCFISGYLFRNTTPIPLSSLRRYKWDFGNDSTYEAIAPFDATEIAQYDTITAIYTVNGEFPPALILEDITGCIDSIRYTNANSSILIPRNIAFEFDVVTMRQAPQSGPRPPGFADSVCIGSRSSSTICFEQTEIEFAVPGTGDFRWNFDDPASMQLNTDIQNWDPCHVFVGGPGTYFPTLTINNVCPNPIVFPYYAAITLHDDKYLDKVIYANNDTTDAESRPRRFADFRRTPLRKLDKYKLAYTGNFSVVFGDTVYSYKGKFDRPLYYISRDSFVYTPAGTVRDTIELPFDTIRLVTRPGGLPPDTFEGYKFYGYGVRIIGPRSRIENPQAMPPVVISPTQKNQCGNDTVDFVNTTLYYKSRKIYRRWEFGDNYAPQCTSFSVPKAGWPQLITAIQPFDSLTYDNGKTWVKFGPSVTRSWRNAQEQFTNSDHYFIANGVTYGGKMPCQFSFDTLPRHGYPNWDSVFLWHTRGKDFMPWTPAQFSLTGTPGTTRVDPADTMWWGKSVFLNPVSGAWSLTQGSGPAPYGAWVRIDTMNLRINNGQDLRKGAPINIQLLPNPFTMPKGDFKYLSGGQLEPTTCIKLYQTILVDTNTTYQNSVLDPLIQFVEDSSIHCGNDLIPGTSNYTFYEYAFRRLVQQCNTVTLRHRDTFNNETDEGTGIADSLFLDNLDCEMNDNVQLSLVKPDGRGLDKTGSKECPGLSPNQIVLRLNGNPGVMPDCGGQTSFLLNLDSLADRQDGTPCTLDGFTGFGGGTTPGGLNRLPFFPTPNFQPLPWTSPNQTVLVYHYGLGSGTPPPADTARGFITLGVIIGTGCKDTITPGVFLNAQLKNNPGFYNVNYNALPNTFSAAGNISVPAFNPQTGGPVFVPGVGSTYNYRFNKIFNPRPIALPGGGIDTLVDIQYTDCNWSRCYGDTVWYHKFLQIQNLAAGFTVQPGGCRLRKKGYPGVKEYRDDLGNLLHTDPNAYLGEEIMVSYQDSLQDSIKYDVWLWGDLTMTVDSFWYSPKPLNDGFYTNGVRRVRYNFDISDPVPVLLDSTVWPNRSRWPGDNQGLKYGDTRLINGRPSRDTIFFHSYFDDYNTISAWPSTPLNDALLAAYVDSLAKRSGSKINKRQIIPPFDSIIVQRKCPTVPSSSPLYSSTLDTIPWRDVYDFYRYNSIVNNTYKPDSIIIQSRRAPFAFDTIARKDTILLWPVDQIIDSAMMFFPIRHVFRRTSWEAAGKGPGSTTSGITHFIGSVKGCTQRRFFPTTVGIIDTFDILNSTGAQDTIYCENEEVFFVDSLRYWRIDCTITNVPNGNPARSVSGSGAFGLGGGPFENLQIDSADFWRQDVGDPRQIQNIVPVFPPRIDLISNVSPAGTAIDEFRLNWNPITGFPQGLVRWDGTKWVVETRNNYKGIFMIDTVVPERVYWDFGDGSPIDSSVRPVHRYKQFGTYKVTMASRDSLGGRDTCVRYVYIARPVAKPVPSQISFNCGQFAQIIDSSFMIYGNTDPNAPKIDSVRINYWWFGEDQLDTVNFDAFQQPTATWAYRRNGTFRVKLAVETYQGCVDTAYTSLFINGPRPLFRLENLSDTVGCAPFKVRIINMADSLGKFVDAITGQTLESDTPTRVTYIFWGDKGNSQSVPIIDRRDTIEFTYNDTGEFFIYAVGLDALPGNPTNCLPVYYPDTVFQNRVKIRVFDPVRSVTLDKQVICVESPVIVTTNSDPIYQTYDYSLIRVQGDSIVQTSPDQPQPNSVNFSYTKPGLFYIVARPDSITNEIPFNAKANCRLVDTLPLRIVQPLANFSIDTGKTPKFEFKNLSDTSTNFLYEWVLKSSTGEVIKSQEGTNQSPDFSADLGNNKGTFTVCLTSYASGLDKAEGCFDSICKTITNEFEATFTIPNVFSPNGDGINDIFDINAKSVEEFNITIYNRWGSKVFESQNVDVEWNGTNKNDGGECPAGVYYYVVEYKLRNEEPKNQTGTVTLIRKE